jgi:predicted MFS family arabinose efflux permease
MPRPPVYVVVWLLLVLAWTGNFAIRVGFSALLPAIIRDLDLTYTAAGVLASAFFYAYMALQLPSGMLGDRVGRRRVLLIGLLGGALATFSTGLTVSFATLFLARLATGACQGSLFSNDRALIVALTPPDRLALGQGVSFAGPGLGLLLGLLLGGVLGERWSWRAVFMLFALWPLVAALAIWRWVPAPPRIVSGVPLGTRLRGVFGTREIWLIGAAGTMGIFVQFVLATWAPLFFIESGVPDMSRAGALSSLQGAAAVAGLVGGGFADDRARRRGLDPRAVPIASLVGLVLSMALMGLGIGGRSPLTVGVALVLAGFFVWSIWGPMYALFSGMVPPESLATAFGLYNTICFSGAVVGPMLIGWMRDVTGSFVAGSYLCAGVAAAAILLTLAVRPPGRA